MNNVLALVLLGLAGCTLEPPGAPVWTIEATVPFSQRVFKMGELVTDSSRLADRGWGITYNPVDSVLQFEFRDSLEYQQIGDRITYEASDLGVYDNRIGRIHIEEPDPDTDTVAISEANPLLQPGYTGPVVPFELEEAQDTMRFDIFQWVRVQRGYLRLSVSNTYPFEVRDLTINLRNLTDGFNLGSVVFPVVRQGESATDSIDLSGKLVYNEMMMTANGRSPGAANVTITGAEALNLVVGVSSTDVDSARAEIAEQSFSNPDQLSIDSRNQIIRAEVKRGRAFFRLTNTTRMRLVSDMIFENFFDSTGTPISRRLVLNPESVGSLAVINLNGAIIQMPINDQGLRVSNNVSIEDSRITRYQGDSYQVITGDQGVKVEYWTESMTMKSFQGIIDSITVDFPEMVQSVEFPDGLNNIRFTRDSVFVDVVNESLMPLKLNVAIESRNSRDNTTVSLPVVGDLRPGLNQIIVPDADRLVSILPDTIMVKGWAGLGRKFFPGVGEVADTNGFKGLFTVRSALRFELDSTRIMTTPHELDDPLDYPLESVDLTVHLVNSIPLYGHIQLMMGNDTSNMIPVIEVDIPRREIQNHRAVAAADTILHESLTETELEMMKHSPLFTRQVLIFKRNFPPDTTWIYGDDSLSIQAAATVHYWVNPSETK
jgi:hypothetical protein